MPLMCKLHEIGLLFLTKIIKIIATRCQILRPKCPDRTGGVYIARTGGVYSTPPDLWLVGRGYPSPRTLPSALDTSGLNPAVLAHFSFPTLACLHHKQNNSDVLPSYPPDNQYCLDIVYWSVGGKPV